MDWFETQVCLVMKGSVVNFTSVLSRKWKVFRVIHIFVCSFVFRSFVCSLADPFFRLFGVTQSRGGYCFCCRRRSRSILIPPDSTFQAKEADLDFDLAENHLAAEDEEEKPSKRKKKKENQEEEEKNNDGRRRKNQMERELGVSGREGDMK